MTCPWCGSPNAGAETVDIGVGEIAISMPGCNDCHAIALDYDEVPADEHERSTMWRRGEHSPEVPARNGGTP